MYRSSTLISGTQDPLWVANAITYSGPRNTQASHHLLLMLGSSGSNSQALCLLPQWLRHEFPTANVTRPLTPHFPFLKPELLPSRSTALGWPCFTTKRAATGDIINTTSQTVWWVWPTMTNVLGKVTKVPLVGLCPKMLRLVDCAPWL